MDGGATLADVSYKRVKVFAKVFSLQFLMHAIRKSRENSINLKGSEVLRIDVEGIIQGKQNTTLLK